MEKNKILHFQKLHSCFVIIILALVLYLLIYLSSISIPFSFDSYFRVGYICIFQKFHPNSPFNQWNKDSRTVICVHPFIQYIIKWYECVESYETRFPSKCFKFSVILNFVFLFVFPWNYKESISQTPSFKACHLEYGNDPSSFYLF